MKTITRRAATLVAAGALGLGGLAVAAPALAGAGPFGPGPSSTATTSPSGPRMGYGYGMGSGFGDGTCMGLGVTAQQGTLTDAQKTTMASMAQEEKLAHDLYVAFAARYDATVFDHIAVTESQHLTAVHTLLQRYGVTDPTENQQAGTFTDPAVQATYDKLLAQGKQSLSAALTAGQQVERTDIADLRAALNGLTAPDAKQVYDNLLAASQRHLTAASTSGPHRSRPRPSPTGANCSAATRCRSAPRARVRDGWSRTRRSGGGRSPPASPP